MSSISRLLEHREYTHLKWSCTVWLRWNSLADRTFLVFPNFWYLLDTFWKHFEGEHSLGEYSGQNTDEFKSTILTRILILVFGFVRWRTFSKGEMYRPQSWSQAWSQSRYNSEFNQQFASRETILSTRHCSYIVVQTGDHTQIENLNWTHFNFDLNAPIGRLIFLFDLTIRSLDLSVWSLDLIGFRS